jgi:hydrogenase nickel incorporation protein HypA/HybF
MHEMGIAASVLDGVRQEMSRHGDMRPRKLALRVGELAGIDPEALRFCLEAMARDTELACLAFEIEFCPRRHRCTRCAKEFSVQDYDVRCPACGCALSHCISGDELELVYLEVDEYEPSTLTT